MFRFILKSIIALLCALALLLAYFTYQANRETSRDQLIKTLDKTLNRAPAPSYRRAKKLDPHLQEFILNVVIRGLPSLKQAFHNCRRRIKDELSARGILVSGVSPDDAKALKELDNIFRKQFSFFEVNDLNFKVDPTKYFFPSFKKNENKTNPFYKTVPKEIFFQSLETYMKYQSCVPEDLLQLIERISSEPREKKETYFHSFSDVHAPLNPTRFYINFLTHRNSLSFKNEPIILEMEKAAQEVHDLLSRPITEQVYQRINELILAQNLVLEEVEQKQRKKVKLDKSRETKERAKKTLLSELRKMPPEKKRKFLEGIKFFNKYIHLNEEEILEASYELDASSTEHDVVIVTSVLKRLSNFFEDSLFEALELKKGAKDEEIAFKTLTVLSNIEQYIKKDQLKKAEKSKELQLSKDEANQVQAILQSFNKKLDPTTTVPK